MFDWIYSNREVFLANYVDIGRNHGIFKYFPGLRHIPC